MMIDKLVKSYVDHQEKKMNKLAWRISGQG
jgi:hypothetical protein